MTYYYTKEIDGYDIASQPCVGGCEYCVHNWCGYADPKYGVCQGNTLFENTSDKFNSSQKGNFDWVSRTYYEDVYDKCVKLNGPLLAGVACLAYKNYTVPYCTSESRLAEKCYLGTYNKMKDSQDATPGDDNHEGKATIECQVSNSDFHSLSDYEKYKGLSWRSKTDNNQDIKEYICDKYGPVTDSRCTDYCKSDNYGHCKGLWNNYCFSTLKDDTLCGTDASGNTGLDAVIFNSDSSMYYFFKGNYFWSKPMGGNITGPILITTGWPNFPTEALPLDAAIFRSRGNQVYYFFKGNKSWRKSYGENSYVESSNWFPRDLDAAVFVNEKNPDKYYFLKGNDYWRKDYDDSLGSKKTISGGWNGFPTEALPLDAAVYNNQSNRYYFFKGNKYWWTTYDEDGNYHEGDIGSGWGLPCNTDEQNNKIVNMGHMPNIITDSNCQGFIKNNMEGRPIGSSPGTGLYEDMINFCQTEHNLKKEDFVKSDETLKDFSQTPFGNADMAKEKGFANSQGVGDPLLARNLCGCFLDKEVYEISKQNLISKFGSFGKNSNLNECKSTWCSSAEIQTDKNFSLDDDCGSMQICDLTCLITNIGGTSIGKKECNQTCIWEGDDPLTTTTPAPTTTTSAPTTTTSAPTTTTLSPTTTTLSPTTTTLSPTDTTTSAPTTTTLSPTTTTLSPTTTTLSPTTTTLSPTDTTTSAPTTTPSPTKEETFFEKYKIIIIVVIVIVISIIVYLAMSPSPRRKYSPLPKQQYNKRKTNNNKKKTTKRK